MKKDNVVIKRKTRRSKTLKGEDLAVFGQRLRDLRLFLGVTQKEMADQIGSSSSQISDIEKGRTGPGYDFLKRLSGRYKINPSHLYHGEEPKFLNAAEKDNLAVSQPKAELRLEDFGDSASEVLRMLSYMKASGYIKHNILALFDGFLIDKKEVLRIYLQGTGLEVG